MFRKISRTFPRRKQRGKALRRVKTYFPSSLYFPFKHQNMEKEKEKEKEQEKEEEETSLCCICETRPAKTAFSAPWIRTTCTGHRNVLFCEECFLSWIYDVANKGLPSYFDFLRKDSCPTCRQKVFFVDFTFSVLSNGKIDTIEEQILALMDYIRDLAYRVNVYIAKLHPGKPFSDMLLDNEIISTEKARDDLMASFMSFVHMMMLFLYRHEDTPLHFFATLFENICVRSSIFKIFALKEIRDVFTEEATNKEDEAFTQLIKSAMQVQTQDHPTFEGMFLRGASDGGLYVFHLKENETIPTKMY